MLAAKIVFIYFLPQMNFIMCGHEDHSNNYLSEIRYAVFSPENPNLKAITVNNSEPEKKTTGAKVNAFFNKKVFSYFLKNSKISLKQSAVQATDHSKIRKLGRFRRTLKTIELRCTHEKSYSKKHNFLQRCVKTKLDETRKNINHKKAAEPRYVKELKTVKYIESPNPGVVPVAEVKDRNTNNEIISLSKNEINKNKDIDIRHLKNKLKDKGGAKNTIEDNTSEKISQNSRSDSPGKKNFSAGNVKSISNKRKKPSKSKVKYKKINSNFKSKKNETKIPLKSKKPLPAKVNKADLSFKKDKNWTRTSYKSTKNFPSKNKKLIKTHKNFQTNTKIVKPSSNKRKNKFKNSKIPKLNKSKNETYSKMGAIKKPKYSSNLVRNVHKHVRQDQLLKYHEDLKSRYVKKNIQRNPKEQLEIKAEKMLENNKAKNILNKLKIRSKITANAKPVIKTLTVNKEHRSLKVPSSKERNDENLLNEVKNFIVKRFAKEPDKRSFYSIYKKQGRKTRNSNKDELIKKAKLTSKSISNGFSLTHPKAQNEGINILENIKNYVVQNFHSGRLKRSSYHKKINSNPLESDNYYGDNNDNLSDIDSENLPNVEKRINSRIIKRFDNTSLDDARSMTLSEYDDTYNISFTNGLSERYIENQNDRDVDNYDTYNPLSENNKPTTEYVDEGYQTNFYSLSNKDSSTESDTIQTEQNSIDILETTTDFYTGSSSLLELNSVQEISDMDLEKREENTSTDKSGKEKISRRAESLKFFKAEQFTSFPPENDVSNSTDVSFAIPEVSTSSMENNISATNTEVGDMSNSKSEPSTNDFSEIYSNFSENFTNSLVYSSSVESINRDILPSTDIIPSSSGFSTQEFSNSFSPFSSSSDFENSLNSVYNISSEKSFSTITYYAQNDTLDTSSLSVSSYSSTSSEDINQHVTESSSLSSVPYSVFTVNTVDAAKKPSDSTNNLSISTTTELLNLNSNTYQITSTTKASKVYRDLDNIELANNDSEGTNEYINSENITVSPKILQLKKGDFAEIDNRTYILVYSDSNTVKFIELTNADRTDHKTPKTPISGIKMKTNLDDTEINNEDENEYISTTKLSSLPKVKSNGEFRNSDNKYLNKPNLETEEFEESVDYTSISASAATSMKVVDKNSSVEIISSQSPSALSEFTETFLADISANYDDTSTNTAVTLDKDYDENLEEAKTEEVTNKKAYDHKYKNYYIKTSLFQYLNKTQPGTNLKFKAQKQQRDKLSEKDESNTPIFAYSVTLQNAKIMPVETTTSISKTSGAHPKSAKSKNEAENSDEMAEEYYDEIGQRDHDIDEISEHSDENSAMKSSKKNMLRENEKEGRKNPRNEEQKQLTNLKLNAQKHQRDELSENDGSSTPVFAYSVTLQNAKIMPDETTIKTSGAHLKSAKSKNEAENSEEMAEEHYDEIGQKDHDIDEISEYSDENSAMKSSKKNMLKENEEEGRKNPGNEKQKQLTPDEISSEYSFDSSTVSDVSETSLISEEDTPSTTENDYDSSTEIPSNSQESSKMKSNIKRKRFVEHLQSLFERLKQKRHHELEKKYDKKVRKVRSVHNVVPRVSDSRNKGQFSLAKYCLIAVVGFAFILSVTVGMYRIIINCYIKRKGQYEIITDHSQETLQSSINVSEPIHFNDEIGNKQIGLKLSTFSVPAYFE